VKFAVPFFISNLIQSLYSLVDLIILGHFGGTNSISAANIGGQVLVILTNLAAGLAGGGMVMLGNYLGSRQKDKIIRSTRLYKDWIKLLIKNGTANFTSCFHMFPFVRSCSNVLMSVFIFQECWAMQKKPARQHLIYCG